MGQLSEGVKYAVPMAKQFGISVEQVSTALGILNTAGLEGSMAATAFAATMRQMVRASQDLGFEVVRTANGGLDFIGTLEAIRAKFGDFNTMSDATRLRVILGGIEWNALQGAILDAFSAVGSALK